MAPMSEGRSGAAPLTQSGVARIGHMFAAAERQGRAALMPYVTGGYPRLAVLPELLAALATAGADAVELGIPFSDPLADGPALQSAATQALAAGFRLEEFWAVLSDALRDYPLPVVLLCYINPILAHGPSRFLDSAQAVGVSGLIVPDLPWREADRLRRLTERQGLALVPMATPNSPADHLAQIRSGRGFVYGVSVTGVTGVRDQLAPDVLAFARRLQQAVPLPVAIGFGISTPAQAQEVGRVADGVIVGSAIVRAQMERPTAAGQVTERLVREFRAAMRVRDDDRPAKKP